MSVITEKSLIQQATQRLRELLAQVPFVKLLEMQPVARGEAADFVLGVDTPDGVRYLVAEVKRELSPRTLRFAAQQLKADLAGRSDAVGLIVAPYLSDRSQELCQELGVSCLDLVGNARLIFGQVFIDRSGRPNPVPLRRLQRSLFSPRASRVLRVLLENPSRRWHVRELAKESTISLGQVSNVKRLLTEQEFITTEGRAFWLVKPEELLRGWAQAYRYEANDVQLFYTMQRLPEIEQALVEECERRGVRYGLALFSGAMRVAPYARYLRASAYIEEGVSDIAAALDLRPVDSGANVALLSPYDEGVFYGLQEVAGAKIVSDIQLYLDLRSTQSRGEEAAEFLYERRIRTRWNPEPNQTTPPPQ